MSGRVGRCQCGRRMQRRGAFLPLDSSPRVVFQGAAAGGRNPPGCSSTDCAEGLTVDFKVKDRRSGPGRYIKKNAAATGAMEHNKAENYEGAETGHALQRVSSFGPLRDCKPLRSDVQMCSFQSYFARDEALCIDDFEDHRSDSRGKRGAFRSAQRPARSAKQGPHFHHNSLALFHHLQRERAVPAPISARTRPLTVRRTVDSRAGDGSGLIVTDGVISVRARHCQTLSQGFASPGLYTTCLQKPMFLTLLHIFKSFKSNYDSNHLAVQLEDFSQLSPSQYLLK
ncbi:hypothetical protein F2P81_010777 [Scophthalmus maximus]|uniref:Uncharacterized protein n=1 Tax=Scophthalmus maximus TaxID=52904 RepID=A0A6A4SVB8_SCOMX|nr:hypothetical protein F2P81_010777 [Scophthalmus maximus]